MENVKPKENRRGKSRRRSGRKDDKGEVDNKMKYMKSKEFISHCTVDAEDKINIMPQETSLVLENSENENENNSAPSLMCPALRRQLETHKNILRLLHEFKLASTQINGQRILSIQPFRWNGPTPGIECEIFVGRIPKTIYEDTLYPLFKLIGEVFQIRLMVDMAELTRGYCFIMYTNPEDATCAITQLDQYEILPGKRIRVLASVNKCKLYVGPLPWQIPSEEVVRVIYASAWDIEYVSIYRFLNHDAAYAIVSFKSHRNAALARRKLRPERLFKCNEVHVEWARVDWNPSNVYEDRGTVNDKGNVQISRRYLQSRKPTSSPISVLNNFNHCQKKLLPISPPDDSIQTNPPKYTRNSTRYSTMLTMSAALDESPLFDSNDKKPEMVVDINDNVQSLDGYYNIFKKNAQCNKEIKAGNFRSFDMWNSNLVSQLSDPHTNVSSKESYDTTDKMSSISSCNWESNAIPKTLSTGYQYLNGTSSSDYYNYYSTNETIDHNRTVAMDTVRCQTLGYQNHLSAPCYVLLRPQNYLYPKDTVTYLQPAVANHIRGDGDQKGALSSAKYDHPPSHYNEQINTHGSMNLNSAAIEKHGDWKLQHAGSSAKSENGSATICQSSSYNQDYAPNIMVNFMPIYTSNTTRSPAVTPAPSYLVPNSRPILKRTTDYI